MRLQTSEGVSQLRTLSVTGSLLPTPRLVSTSMHYDLADAHRRYSLAVMQWGQFLDHDITLTPMVEYPDKSNISGCHSANLLHQSLQALSAERFRSKRFSVKFIFLFSCFCFRVLKTANAATPLKPFIPNVGPSGSHPTIRTFPKNFLMDRITVSALSGMHLNSVSFCRRSLLRVEHIFGNMVIFCFDSKGLYQDSALWVQDSN